MLFSVYYDFKLGVLDQRRKAISQSKVLTLFLNNHCVLTKRWKTLQF